MWTSRLQPSIRRIAPFPESRLHAAFLPIAVRWSSTLPQATSPSQFPEDDRSSHLHPDPDSYSLTPFADRCTVSLHAGSGGHGCVSFVRDRKVANGPPNGGDGGSGGNIYVQAVHGETSLHKLARSGLLKAGRGGNGRGQGQGGKKGNDLLITVPVGTVVREMWRHDPVAEEEVLIREEGREGNVAGSWRRDRWLLYPGTLASEYVMTEFPRPPLRKPYLAASEPSFPIRLDLDEPMERPMLLVAGAMGGLGNPRFITRNIPRPKFATKGDSGTRVILHLELKLLADVGLVGLPNAGKSTLLRALSNSRARVGSWAFTTLQPNIGTVVLDDHKSRPKILRRIQGSNELSSSFTVADIPGLIEDAHLDRGLGLGFLRHIERASVLAFVIDLSAGDAVAALKGLWREVGQYEVQRDAEVNAETQRLVEWKPGTSTKSPPSDQGLPDITTAQHLPSIKLPPISNKPWFVVATKADLPATEENFKALQAYLFSVAKGELLHPSGRENAWKKRLHAIPVSAIQAEGVDKIPEIVVNLLDGC